MPRLRKPEKLRAADTALVTLIRTTLGVANSAHFGGKLPELPVYLSGRFKSTMAWLWTHDDLCGCGKRVPAGTPEYFVFSRAWVARATTDELYSLSCHELVHLWQAVHGDDTNHGKHFQEKAAELGLSPFWCRS